MNKLIRFGVAGALMAGYVTAQAQPLPSSGNSDLWLFVSDPSKSTTFALDTGMSLSSIAPTSSFAAGNSPSTPTAILSTAISANFTLPPSAALSAYITAAGTDALQWSVEGIQFPGTITGTGYRKPGGIVGMTANPASQATNTSNEILSPNVQNWASGFQQDVAYLAATYVAGGKSYAWSAGSSTGQVWEPGVTGGFAGATDLYGQGPDTAGIAPGTSLNLYALTGNSGLGQVQSYLLGTNLTMSSAGQLSVGGAVPLPAAVWLFGSGLLGLLGVGRRRAATT